jgi:rhamnose utilization protein RhaD (predicted bifunctional aldolase and dehydrogenase)
MRVYTSRLLGQEPDLVLHGGGNTSVKIGDTLYVKGSGWNLDTIEAEGFAPVAMDALLEMADRETLSDTEMVALQRQALRNPSAPNPSIEAILHALIPATYVDHTHADAVVTISNTPDGRRRLERLYGEKMLIVDYVMPGFELARTVRDLTREIDWEALEGILLMHHGVFTFADTAERSYRRMIEIVTRAETYLEREAPLHLAPPDAEPFPDELLDALSRELSRLRGRSVTVSALRSPEALALSRRPGVKRIVHSGGLTPEHVIRIKPFPALLNPDNPLVGISAFAEEYDAYFRRYANAEHRRLDPAPRWGVVPGNGVLLFTADEKERRIVTDIVSHTIRAMLRAEMMGGWHSLNPEQLFAMEYWELEQAKLRKQD